MFYGNQTDGRVSVDAQARRGQRARHRGAAARVRTGRAERAAPHTGLRATGMPQSDPVYGQGHKHTSSTSQLVNVSLLGIGLSKWAVVPLLQLGTLY